MTGRRIDPAPPPGDDRPEDRALFGDAAPPDDAVADRIDLPDDDVLADEFTLLAGSLVAVPADAPAPPPHLAAAVRADAERYFSPPATVEAARGPKARPWWKFGDFTVGFATAIAIAVAIGGSPMFPASAGRPRLAELPPDRAWERLTASDGSVRVPVASSGEDAESVGDLVWSPEDQFGALTLTGLARNDPAESQYQLWIFDADRDERYPVDGGVFDVPASGEAVVPFAPRVPVGRATLFAVTVERPGGVVVSDRSRLPALAKVPGA